MTGKNWQSFWQLSAAMLGAIVTSSENPSLAQITPDNTLGAESSVVTPLDAIGLPFDSIEGGAIRGANLFHSFSEFNIDEGRGAYFFSPANIANILTRVTGGNPSNILGTLGTFGDSQPNFFLINPNGIIFGPNAKLDVGGSFVATTANGVGWKDKGFFSASAPESSTLLTINPDVFFFNQLSNQAEIVNLSTATNPVLGFYFSDLPFARGLQVLEGRSLLLLGGDVKLEGGVLQAWGGQIELGGLSKTGIVGLSINGDVLSLEFPDEVARGDVALNSGAEVDVALGSGGNIAINAQNVDVLDGSFLDSGIATGFGSVDSQAGDIEINATGSVRLSESLISNRVFGTGKGGEINITAVSLEITNGAQLVANTFGVGNAGDVKIVAIERVTIDGVGSNNRSSGAFSEVGKKAIGNGGDIEITTASLEVANGAQLATSTFGVGNAGDVKITATEKVRFDGVGSNDRSSGAFSIVGEGAVGNGGDVEINTASLEVTNGAQPSASTFGQGSAGNVKITATEKVTFDGVGNNVRSSGAFSSVNSGARGDGGNVEINTASLEITNGAQLVANTFGAGNAGDVKIVATERVTIDGVGSNNRSSGAFSEVGKKAIGNGGDIEITTASLEVANGARLAASTFGVGNAGSVRITATERVTFDGVSSNGFPSGILSRVQVGAVGDGGDIEINTTFFDVTNGAVLSASTFGVGNAGSVRITATERVTFDGVGSNGFSSAAFSTVQAGAVGNAGDIKINTASLEVTNGAQIAAGTFGQGDAGDVRINATQRVSFDGVGSNGASSGAFSTVEAEALGDGGDVEVTTASLEVTNGAQLSASTFGVGNAGNVKIVATERVSFDGVGSNNRSSGTFSEIGNEAIGNGGNVEINTASLEVTNGALLNASTSGEGNAGNIRITASQSIRFDGIGSSGISSGVFSSVNSGARGDGGNVEINTASLEVINGAQIGSGIFGEGNAGNVRIIASERISLDGVSSNGFSSGVFSTVEPGGVGNGGDVEITTASLEVTNGALLNASTFGEGNAGNVRITASERVSLDGVGSNGFSSGVFSTVNPGAVGEGGDIEITTGSLSLADGLISSVSAGTGKAGDVNITTQENLEANRSSIIATTQSDDGGNINLEVGDLLLLRNNSNISTTAGLAGSGGDGGNIDIAANFIVGVSTENSDITANAFNGRGGNINITTQGIYGLQFREQLTPLSDITASSEFGLALFCHSPRIKIEF